MFFKMFIRNITGVVCCLFVYLAQQPPVGHGLLIHEVSRSQYYSGRNKNSVKIVINRMIQEFLCTSKNNDTFLLVVLLV